MREALGVSPPIQVRASHDKGTTEIRGPEDTVLLDVHVCRPGDAIEAQIVFIEIDFRQQFSFKGFVLHCIYFTFEHGLLDPLAEVPTNLCDAPQSLSAAGGFRRNVVSDDN